MLAGEGLAKRYGRRPVVDHVDLEVRPGEVVGLLGPNGAGKTTCFGMLAGLIRSDAGKVLLNGQNITRMPMYERARAGIGYLPQEPSVFRGLSVEENLLLVTEARGIGAGDRARRVARMLRRFELESLRGQKALLLSGGERRRLEIARTMILEPEFLLLDEPFTGVDPMGVSELKDWIGEFARAGIGVFLIDHNVRECLIICDRILLLYSGKVVARGTPAELLEETSVRDLYLGSHFELS